MADNNYNKVEVLIVGAGPGGLTCAIQLKILPVSYTHLRAHET